MLVLGIGRRELGKTTLAMNVARRSDTRVAFDPRHLINTTTDVLNEENVEELLYEMLDTRSEIIVQPNFDVQGAFAKTCQILCDWIRDNPGETVCLLLDEVRFYEPDGNPHFEFIV